MNKIFFNLFLGFKENYKILNKVICLKMAMFTKLKEKDPEKYPERIGQKWSKEEQKQLLDEIASNKSIEEIAKIHKRTERGIKCELEKQAIYICNVEKKSIEEAQIITGLDKLNIEIAIKTNSDALQKRKEKEKLIESKSLSKTKTKNKIEHIIEDNDSVSDKLERIEYKLDNLQAKVNKIFEYIKSIQ